MASPTVWDEDFQCYVHAQAIANAAGGATTDGQSRTALGAISTALKIARITGRDEPLVRSCSLVKTNGAKAVTSADASFVAGDVGAAISGTGLPAGCGIAAVTDGTHATLSAPATASSTNAATITVNVSTPQVQGFTVWDANRSCFVGAAAIANPTGGTPDPELRAAIVQVLTALRGAGVIAHTATLHPTVWDATAACYTFSAYTAPSGGTFADVEARAQVALVAAALQSRGYLSH